MVLGLLATNYIDLRAARVNGTTKSQNGLNSLDGDGSPVHLIKRMFR
jgi:hypothetical protein